MLLTHHGHSEFLIETKDGYRILTDPFDAHVGYPMRDVPCDAALVSHGHGDHAYVSKAVGARVIDKPGKTTLTEGVAVTGIPSFHDDAQGAKRGGNIIFMIEADGLRVAHLGDLGQWEDAYTAALGDIDVLLVPVGGFYTIDAAQAAAIVRALNPRVTIPMHYATAVNAAWPIKPVDGFLDMMNAPGAPRMPLLRITREDVSQQPRICVLTEA